MIELENAIKVNLGSGRFNIGGFVNVDIVRDEDRKPDVQSDALEYLQKLPDESVEEIYCGHFIEHLTREETGDLLTECKRVMIPGGLLTVTVPDAEKALLAHIAGTLDLETLHGCVFGELSNEHEVHKQVFSVDILDDLLGAYFRETHVLDNCIYWPAAVVWQTTISAIK